MKKLAKCLGQGFTFLCLLGSSNLYAQNCGLDIYIANDQSGSVSAADNLVSRELVTQLAQAHALGNANNQNRIAVSEWDLGFVPFVFPVAGPSFTTDMSDVMAYKNAMRTLNGGTDVYTALYQSYLKQNQSPVTNRTVRKVIILFTDASGGQVSPNISALASKVKATGSIIAVIAAGPASSVPVLQGTNVASTADLYFPVANYAALKTTLPAVVTSLLTNLCAPGLPDPTWDLTVTADLLNCGTGQVNYTINNTSALAFTNHTITTSFYDGHPYLPGSRLLATDVHTGQSIPGGGSTSFSLTDPAFELKSSIWAVVNLNTSGSNTLAPLPEDLRSRLEVAGEQNTINNISLPVTGTGCSLDPVLEVSNKLLSVGCDRNVSYQVKVCNTGAGAASNVQLNFLPHTNLVLKTVTATSGTGKFNAAYVHPGGDISSSGYDGYSNTPLYPCASTAVNSGCANYNYTTVSNGFYTSAVFSFPPASTNTGVPFGANIISARLTASVPPNIGNISGIKGTNIPKFDATNHPGDMWLADHTDSVAALTSVIDVTAIAQQLVNQPGWTNNSTMAYFWRGPKVIFAPSSGPASSLEVTYTMPFSVPGGECATFTYVYQDTSAAGGNYNASAAVTTSTTGATIQPNTSFTANGISGLNGYDGSLAANTTDDVSVPGTTGCSQTPQAITTSVVMTPTSTCAGEGNYVTATVTIQNPNTQPLPAGITLYDLTHALNLTGTGTKFLGEPYDLTNNLHLAAPNILDPAYPAVPNSLTGKSGLQALRIYQLAPGTSTFKIDIVAGTTSFNLTSTVLDIPAVYNAGGRSATAQDATGVTISALPTATINCPASVSALATSLTVTATTTGAGGSTPVKWSSNTNGIFTANGTSSTAAPDYNYTITDLDRANGKVDLQLNVYSATGCEGVAYCTVPITGTQMDYGDLPASYDFNGDITPIAAGAMNPTNNMKLGTLGAGPDALVKSSQKADGDGAEEDGVTAFNPITPGINSYSVDVNYTSDVAATVCGWFDWNNNGHFDAGEGVCNAVPAQVNGVTTLSWSNINGGNGPGGGMLGYSRFRISSDNMDVNSFYGPTTNGEVEDYNILAVALPLNLLNFDAQKTDGDALLSWTTADEVNTAYFDVEASTNGTLYQAIGRVQAAGNSSEKQQYSFRHQQPAAGRYYYRLKMADKDGTIRYSGTRILHFGGQETVVLQPNPARNQVNISGVPQNSRIRIMDATGRVALQATAQAMSTKVSLETLAPGHYMVSITNAEGAVISSSKLVKQ
jgi:hypothetical protein